MRQTYTTREIGDLLGVAEWRVRRLFEVGRLPEPGRFAGKRAIPPHGIGEAPERGGAGRQWRGWRLG